MRRKILRGLVILAALFVLIQLIPYGRSHTNPPVGAQAPFDSPQTQQLAQRACFDCHSNQTTWPWYSNVAPISWLTQRDVDTGRARLNFSDWNQPQNARNAARAANAVQRGSMPPVYYLPTHPTARLSDAEKQALIQGLRASFGDAPGRGGDVGTSADGAKP